MFWIHGGAFTGGTANDATMDGGGLTSRGDVVLVNINYRLSTLGFLALDDGVTKGNYGLGDQIVALDWVRQNIARFGGDPDRITIFGQSAGAGSVRALMASPKAKGKFQRAILLSNLGGLAYGTTYSRYYTIAEEMSVAGQAILNATGCASSPIAQQADCLRAVPAFNLTSMPTVARFLVVDGDILTTQQLQVLGPPLGIDVMLGIMADDGAPFAMFPTTTDAATYLPTQGFPTVPEPAFFPIPPASNFAGNETLALYNMTSRLATDGIFRCVDQATVAAGLAGPSEPSLGRRVFYYEFDRSYQTTGWPKTDVCEAPRTADRPNGDPSLPHFRCHSGELYYVFGTLARQRLPERDGNDYPFMRFVLDAFASFARTGDPNPEVSFLTAKGFDETLREITRDGGRWLPSLAAAEGGTPDSLTMRILQWPEPYQSSFRELPQCASLGIGLDYYMPSAMSGWRRLQ